MTPAEAIDATRDAFASILAAHAQADGVKLSVGQIYGMLDTALQQAGIRALIDVAAAADVAAIGYAGTYTDVPETVAEVDESWRAARDQLADYPNLAGLFAPP